MSARDDGGPAFPCRKCGERFYPKQYQLAKADYECPPCKRTRQNAANAKRDLSAYAKSRNARPDVKAYLRNYQQTKKSDPLHVQKRAARRKVATEIEAGRMMKFDCRVCGSKMAEAHHEDYNHPLRVVWLCRRHHIEADKMEKQKHANQNTV